MIGFNMMSGSDWGSMMSGGGWVLIMFCLVLLTVIVVWAFGVPFNRSAPNIGKPTSQSRPRSETAPEDVTAQEMLNKRFAKGDISADQYRHDLAVLTAGPST